MLGRYENGVFYYTPVGCLVMEHNFMLLDAVLLRRSVEAFVSIYGGSAAR